MKTILLTLILLFPRLALADDAPALQARMNAAVAQGKPLHLEGRYHLDISGKVALTQSSGLLKIVGDGPGLTVLETERELTAVGALLLARPGARLVLEDLTIIGPDNRTPVSNLIYHTGGLGGELTIRRCEIRGGNVAVKMGELGNLQEQPRVLIEDSLLESPTGLLMLNSGTCRVYNTRFAGMGGRQVGHALYLYRPVSLLLDGCDFSDRTGDGFDLHPWSPMSGKPRQFAVRDCVFSIKGTQGILCHPDVPTLIRGCALGSVWTRPAGMIASENTGGDFRPWPY